MRLKTKADRLAYRQAMIPKDVYTVTDTDQAAAYCYPLKTGRYGVIVFRGTAGRPEFHYTYRDLDQATGKIAEWLIGVQQSQQRKANARAEKAAWRNPLKVGDILYTSWGYDQTNTEFYAVTRVSGRRTWVREIAQDYEETGFMSGKSWPVMPIRYIGEETMHTAQPSGQDGVYVKISECIHARPEQGRAHYTSSYA